MPIKCKYFYKIIILKESSGPTERMVARVSTFIKKHAGDIFIIKTVRLIVNAKTFFPFVNKIANRRSEWPIRRN